ncbi:MAG: hypothetical protein ABFS35_04560 [Bacteroidota bacterium]
MKKFILTLVLFTGISIAANAQIVFTSAKTLQKGNFSVGINPAWGEYGYDFSLFLHGGYGVGNNADLNLKIGFGWFDPYVGLDYEKTLLSGKPSVSVYVGGHYWNNFGIDMGTVVTFPIKNINISTGLDADLVFRRDFNDDLDLGFPVWLPLEVEFYLQKHLALTFEADIRLNNPAFTIVGGGLSIYL